VIIVIHAEKPQDRCPPASPERERWRAGTWGFALAKGCMQERRNNGVFVLESSKSVVKTEDPNLFFLGIEDSGTRVFMPQQFLYRVDLITN
jgi:hypothetical protein